MLTITENAQAKIREMLKDNSDDPDKRIRIIQSPEHSDTLELILDSEHEDDRVIEGGDGSGFLVIEEKLSETLDGFVVDFTSSSEGTGFEIRRDA